MCWIVTHSSAIADVVVSCAAIAGAVVAVLGLTTWRQQLRGKTEYDLARRLLKCAYGVRDAVHSIRVPYMDSSEMALALKEDNVDHSQLSFMEFRTKGQYSAFNKRWQIVAKELSGFEVEVLEAEVLWEGNIKAKCTALRVHTYRLLSAIETHLEDTSDEGNSGLTGEERKKNRKIVFRGSGPDDFSAELGQVLEGIEEIARPKLKP